MIMWRDIIYAIRRLAAKPGFSLIALLTLTLGVGSMPPSSPSSTPFSSARCR
jgi:hypothetical protein